jgi:hypothetical protein
VIALLLLAAAGAIRGENVPPELQRWLRPQTWQRDTDGPLVSLGSAGSFDDRHIFAPAVARDGGRFLLWYPGSTGTVAERVFRLGLATSDDGRRFTKHAASPVLAFPDGRRSVLTATLLRNADGSPIREDGRLRLWFSATDFADRSGLHTLHEATSGDGIHWSPPSAPLLRNVYAPTIIRTGRHYQMWFTDVGAEPWLFRHASSEDGRAWRVTPEPVLGLDQPWEKGNLFYPHVVHVDGACLMWYGSYWAAQRDKTALGFAASLDGLKWYKNPHNPVFTPDPRRPWESHYVTSHTVLRLADDSWRIWYASRKAPPFTNKYFALNTAKWNGPSAADRVRPSAPHPAEDRAAFETWQETTRERLRTVLGIPKGRVPLVPERRGHSEHDGIVIERWIFTSEPGSRVPALLYRPKRPVGRMPAIVLTYGHGGSKGSWEYHYAAQLYARLRLACLAIDPLGEEERNATGRMGSRAHDNPQADQRAARAGRLIMGKLVFDTMRAIDFLHAREDIDRERIGVAGYSLGGATAGWMVAVEPRLRLALVSGWAFDDITLRTKLCTRAPNVQMRESLTWTDYASLAAPHCAVFVANGDADVVIDRDSDGSAWIGTRAVVEAAGGIYASLGAPGRIRAWFEPDGGHRPYFAYHESLGWIHRHLGTPGWTLEQIRALPALNAGEWCDRHGISLERLYGTPLHWRGATLPDLGLRPAPREKLAVLSADEIGRPEFTLEGWLDQIER